jgi:hypothetical protein
MPLTGGWIIFDPNHFWIICECHLEQQVTPPQAGSSTGVSHAKFDYKYGRNDFPLITRISNRFEGTVQGTKMQVDTIYDFELVERDDVPDSEFTLSAFGFPEPFGLEASRSKRNWYLWAGGAGILLIVLAVLIRWRHTRTQVMG